MCRQNVGFSNRKCKDKIKKAGFFKFLFSSNGLIVLYSIPGFIFMFCKDID